MTVAVLVSNRPEWVEHGLESAHRISDHVVYRFHSSGEFVDVFNEALREAATFSDVCLKVDDHDVYPDHHSNILDRWEPGVTVWGKARRVTCQGEELKPRATMCSSAIPTNIRLEADNTGRISRSLLDQTPLIKVVTQVVKRLCRADWGWDIPLGEVCPHDVRT